eukprot:CAMPEP_0201569800 /NCGR_PEP_ID=MMETSP0190_2-20130828/11698_1 /ASSEMBLY_ACC=CAM_ASM_000263 /TAXON_ID=37353 /ORGANISM="Rosalina sp." /LENGTH=117 /DNA_ID=CAMNT_0047992561 /DNA_START=75 /DNA_END=425 /DNA_ORIENTATION=-
MNITKKFSPTELFSFISNAQDLIPHKGGNNNDDEPPALIHIVDTPQDPPSKGKQYGGELQILADRLSKFLNEKELDVLIHFCNEQGFTSLEDIETDLDEELIDDSGIVEEMKSKFNW